MKLLSIGMLIFACSAAALTDSSRRLRPLKVNETYSYISATITIPTPTPTGSANGPPSNYQAASAWVGIDGDPYTSAILQSGEDFYVMDGEAYADPWYEWYPNIALFYDEILVNPGDVVVISVNVTVDGKDGVCIIRDLSTGESATQTVAAPKSTVTIRGWSAEWVVEGFHTNGSPVPSLDSTRFGFQDVLQRQRGGGMGVVNNSEIIVSHA
ncbi:A4/G1 family peptidase [Aspergillus tanneri]|uniref:Concanavalin A-like lectin/glucanase n=1 Tax=Aspergillus tanneri TaxID=1220188 RepID=A0A5M9MEM3_9EURO|nr:uncharacterized protein ATNIH1004_006851 [Aspergillus tanneri]KAA8645432.1 hypothetical protein ATNIH1004_006851 [Aspergillus tanneri]